MCGIVAMYSPGGGLTEADVLPGMESLRARGPDGGGAWCSPGGRAVLGHRRLAIIDLVSGQQPITDQDGHTHLVVNGEFYGYRDIRRELIDAGCRLRTNSDSEIALHLYRRVGAQALQRLRGEFAFVLWDERTGELFAARDRFGVKPLYYAWHGGQLLLASEIKALLASGVPARWDASAFAAHLQIAVPTSRTLFAGVSQLPPGHYLRVGESGIEVQSYWDMDYPTAAELDSAEVGWDDHLGEIGAAIEEAVRVRMVADVPIACHLSGGLDSTTVAAIAAQHHRLTAFTVRFGGSEVDESAVAARTARQLGITHHHIDSQPSDFVTYLHETVRAGETVQENAHGIARYLQSRAIRECGYKVALGGEGGDEVFAGYPQTQKDLALSLSPELFASTQRRYRDLASAGGAPRHLRTLLDELGFVPSWTLDRYLSVTTAVQPLLRPEFAQELQLTDASATLLAAAGEQLRDRAPVHQSSYLFAKSWLPNYILASERLDAVQAVEIRLPFLDHLLFATAKHIPLSRYASDGRSKYPLRAAMADRLPLEVHNARKQGFFAPPVAGDDGILAVVTEMAASTAFRDNPFFQPEAVMRFLAQLAGRDVHHRGAGERLVQLIGSVGALSEEFSGVGVR
ncbi:asparagine synthase (glutamine-hydrolyzing) [Mycobacteroides abscessus]|uniref:asparagine synthase (glutamine-hydrolyzing) n=1 Tax=Mycobacteroides abscessus TaxID=36809 RepID=UPI00025846A7|nr:asparagine synthase (glutamine-hydrolyzing) [Mycobacteroides abscessus]EIC67549.1 asparagine synthase [Mycobacteroides abscessus M93]